MANAIWLKAQDKRLRNYLEVFRRRTAVQRQYVHIPICSKEELQVSDRVIERVISTWQHWWRISEGFLRLALQRRLWAGTGRYLQTVTSRRESRFALQRKSWSDLGRTLEGIKAQRDC